MAGKMVQRGPAMLRAKPLTEVFSVESGPRVLVTKKVVTIRLQKDRCCDFCLDYRVSGTLQIVGRLGEGHSSWICSACMKPLIEAFNILTAEENL